MHRHAVLILSFALLSTAACDDAEPTDTTRQDTATDDTQTPSTEDVDTTEDTSADTSDDAVADVPDDIEQDTASADTTLDAPDDDVAQADAEPPDAQDFWLLVGSGAWGGNTDGTVTAIALDGDAGMLAETPATELTVGHLATFMALDEARGVLHVADEVDAVVRSFAFDTATGGLTALDDRSTEGSGAPVYVTLDGAGAHLLASSYNGGRTEVFAIDTATGAISDSVQVVDSGARSHAVVVAPGGDAVVVPALGDDKVSQYHYDETTGTLTPADPAALSLPADTGPRHLVFSHDGTFAWLVGELDTTLSTLAFEGASATLTLIDTIDMRPPGFTGDATGADILLSPDGTTVYASLRPTEDDGWVVVATVTAQGTLEIAGHVSTGGRTPRNLAISPDGRWLAAANQGSDNLTLLAIDAETHLPTAVQTLDVAGHPFFVMFAARP